MANDRPEPDEAQLDGGAPGPQPERREPRLEEPVEPHELSGKDWVAVFKRAGKQALKHQVTDLAAALAYYSFLAIPAALLTAFGLLGVFASPSTLHRVATELGSFGPGQANEFLGGAIERLDESPGQSLTMTIVGFVLALWTTTGAATAFMRALNRAYGRDEARPFLRQRIVALEIVAALVGAFALVLVLIILGPQLSGWLDDTARAGGWVKLVWWAAQWPLLLGGLALAFAAVLYLGPNVDHPRWRLLTPGSAVATLIWVAASGLFAVYTSQFGSYNQTWGSLSAVIIMLTWLWISGLALLFGAEVNAEVERSRELRLGLPAERELQVPPRAHAKT